MCKISLTENQKIVSILKFGANLYSVLKRHKFVLNFNFTLRRVVAKIIARWIVLELLLLLKMVSALLKVLPSVLLSFERESNVIQDCAGISDQILLELTLLHSSFMDSGSMEASKFSHV